METFKIGICEPDHFSKRALDLLSTIGEVRCFEGDDLPAFICDQNALFVRLKYQIDDALLQNASRLRYICSPTTGLNHISCTRPNITVLSLKGEYAFLETIRATPEHIFGLTLSLLRNYAHAFLNPQNAVFNRDPYRGYEIYGSTVGIIGLGRVGRILAGYFTAFGARVRYFDVQPKSCDTAEPCDSVEQLIDASDIVILCANYTPKNADMIDKKHFERMQGKYFVNAARGELVHEADLLNFLQKDWFRGVAVDVLAHETSASGFLQNLLPLVKTRNLIVTPHIGGATFSSMQRTEEFIAAKLVAAIGK